MSISREPKPEHGFIYILSNPSMPNVYKVGLTTNSVKQRVQELNTTGVPRPFKVENIFEIPASKLRQVEQSAHKKLKHKDLHHGKEFFEGGMVDCITAVQDAIYEVTGSESADLIGEAKRRALLDQKQREEKRIEKETAARRKAELEERLRQANSDIDAQRADYIKIAKQLQKNDEPLLTKYFFKPMGFLFIGAIALAIMTDSGPLGWVLVPLVAWWFLYKEKSEAEDGFKNEAAKKLPYYTAENLKNREKTPFTTSSQVTNESSHSSQYESVRSSAPIRRSTAEPPIAIVETKRATIQSLPEISSVDWLADKKREVLYNKVTKEWLLRRAGLGFSISEPYFILYNRVQPRKLVIDSVPVVSLEDITRMYGECPR